MRTAMKYILLGLFFMTLPFLLSSFSIDKKKKKTDPYELLKTNIDGKGTALALRFTAGKSHNHPTLAVWIEDMNGNYIQTLYVTQSLAKGVYAHGEKTTGVWSNEPGEVRRPATLPYYLHKRGVKAADGTYLPTVQNPIPDAYSGATPLNSFLLNTKSDNPLTAMFRLLVEVNQPWDWNSYWNNTKYVDDVDYRTSCQPALIYAVTIDLDNLMEYYLLNPIGHGHFSGKDGLLYTDISTITTAFNIFEKIEVRIDSQKLD